MVKIYSKIKESKNVMFINEDHKRFRLLNDCLGQGRVNLHELPSDIYIEYDNDAQRQIMLNIEKEIARIIYHSGEFVEKETGQCFEFMGDTHFLDSQGYSIDRDITSLNSFYKIIQFCVNNDSLLILETCSD